MELLVCLSIVPATLRPQTRARGRKSYGPSLLIMEKAERRKCTYGACDAGAKGVQYPLFACEGPVYKELVCNRKEKTLPETYASSNV